MPATANIFVSYARTDKGTAVAVVQALRGARTHLPIVPVLLDDTPEHLVPPFLSQFQFHSLSLDDARDGSQIAVLATALHADLFRKNRKPVLPPELGRCLFPGLAPFERQHQAFFFGRHTGLLAALDQFSQRRVDGGRIRWLRIEGNSGVGNRRTYKFVSWTLHPRR